MENRENTLTRKALEEILSGIPALRVGLLGDGCADIYWEADMRKSELSREAPHFPLPVVGERFSLGAGANVAANLAALGPKSLSFITVCGNDWRGGIFLSLLEKAGIPAEHVVRSGKVVTPAYCKPIRRGISDVHYEDPRIDFENREALPKDAEERILEELDRVAAQVDLLVVCDQFRFGCVTPAAAARICELGRSLPVIADSRDRIGRFRCATVKPNEVELARCLGIPALNPKDLGGIAAAAAALSERTGRPAVVTLGSEGACWSDGTRFLHTPAYPAAPPIDFVGAGDTFLAAFSLASALGRDPGEALRFAALASSVTIRKLGVTGTASPDELRAALAQDGG